MSSGYRYPADYGPRCEAEIDLALGHVAGYAAWRGADPGRGCPVDERFAALPLLDKAALRAWGLSGFAAPGRDVEAGLAAREVEIVRSSGTTEEQVTLLWNQPWWDASERASWQLNGHAARAGLSAHAEAILTSPSSTGVATTDGRPLPLHVRRLARFLYLNEHFDSRDWDDDHLRRMAAELADFQPAVLEANPTLMARFCRRLEALGLGCWQPRLIVISYEIPSVVHLRQIARVFPRVPVMSSHGCTEAACVLTQCEAGCFHQNASFVRLDFQPLADRFGLPRVGRIAVTSFGNPWRVLIRFDIGDLVRLRPPGQPCACGRGVGVTVETMEGRTRDLTFDRAGRPVTVGRLDRCLAGVPGLFEYQVSQETPVSWKAAVACDTAGTVRAVREALEDLYGGSVVVERVGAVAPEVSGKHRLAVCQVPYDLPGLFEGTIASP
jgi:phenylacetate-coenzyme A ligase PaaK-like adenylate-forming protein